MLSVRRCAVGALCRLWIALVGIVVSASAQAGGTEDDARGAFLALQRPEIFDIGQEFVEVEFFSGPNLVSYQYSVACYLAQDAVTCADVVGGDTTPLDSVTGSLPRGYSRVLANMTIPDNTDVDCFVTVGGGALNAFSKCQLAGEATTDPLPVPEGYTVAVSSVPGQPDALLVKAEEDTSRDGLLASLFPQEAVSLSRNYDVTYKVQCLPAPATACDPSQTLVDGDDLFTTGTLVTGLIPNTLYQCFVLVEFDGQTRCTPEDFITEVATLPNHPTDVTVSSPAFESLDVAAVAPTGPSGNALPVAGYAFQCSLASECDPSGTWFPSSAPFASDPETPVTVSGLDPDTPYNCWAATVAGDSASYEYFCSDSGQGSTAAAAAPTLEAIPGSTPNEVQVTPTASNAGTTLKVACVPATPSLPTCPDATGAGITWTPASDNTPLQIDETVDGTDMVAGTSYTCYAAEFVGTDYRVCSAGSDVVAALNAPTLTSAVPGPSPGQINVTATAPTGDNANVDSTLRVACLENPGTQPDCPAAGDGAWRNATSSPQAIPGLTAGDLYSCYAAEFANSPADTYRVCSTAVINAVAALNAPTVAASTGTVGRAVLVTGTAPSDANVDAELKVACVEPSGAACPAFDAVGWVNVTNPGVAQQVSTLADGSSMVGGAAYTCYSAEISTHPSVNYGVCSEPGADVTAKTLNQPDVVAVSGGVQDQVSVTGTVPSPGNVGTVLKVACVTFDVDCPAYDATGWENVTVSGQPQQVSKLADGTTDLVAGDSYTCYSAEFVGNDRVCSTGSDVVAFGGELKLVASNSEVYAAFGYSVSLNAAGDVALVGALGDGANSTGSYSGAAYVFTYSSGSWTQTAKLVASDSEADAQFGRSVSLNAAGDVALVGAWRDDANGLTNSGAAYVFTSSSGSWAQTTKLVPSDSEANAYFGFSVSLNAVGDVALVGAYLDDATGGADSGAAYVFTSSAGSWTQTTKLVPSDSEAGAAFGFSVSLNAVGDVALVGAERDDATGGSTSGAAYVFTYSGSWTQTTKLVPSDSEAGAEFGYSVSLNAAGDVALVGARLDDATGGADSGAAYVFTSSAGSWTQTTKLVPFDSEANAYFGISVSLNAAGDVALVGASAEDATGGADSGAAYVFTSSAGSWTQTTKLIPSDSEAGAYFGFSVSLNVAGEVALVGAYWDDANGLLNSGAAYSFRGI